MVRESRLEPGAVQCPNIEVAKTMEEIVASPGSPCDHTACGTQICWGFIVENVGVAPDIEVEQTPSEVIKGNDPQLQKAIEVALKELEKNPPVTPARPPYPVRGNN